MHKTVRAYLSPPTIPTPSLPGSFEPELADPLIKCGPADMKPARGLGHVPADSNNDFANHRGAGPEGLFQGRLVGN